MGGSGCTSIAPPFLTSALDGGEWSASRPCPFTHGTHCVRGWTHCVFTDFSLLQWLTVDDNLVPVCLCCVDVGDIADAFISVYRHTDSKVPKRYGHVQIYKQYKYLSVHVYFRSEPG
jgi:hypothetical protein